MTKISLENIRAEREVVAEIVNDILEKQILVKRRNPIQSDLFRKYVRLMMRRYGKLEARLRNQR
jgi:hypothetical protein